MKAERKREKNTAGMLPGPWNIGTHKEKGNALSEGRQQQQKKKKELNVLKEASSRGSRNRGGWSHNIRKKEKKKIFLALARATTMTTKGK